MMREAGRNLSAFAVCVLGMGLTDQLVAFLRPDLRSQYLPDGKISINMAEIKAFAPFQPALEVFGAAVTILVALLIARPNGIRLNEYNLFVLLLLGLSVGRELFGTGEGFLTSFLTIAIPAFLLSLVIHLIYYRRTGD